MYCHGSGDDCICFCLLFHGDKMGIDRWETRRNIALKEFKMKSENISRLEIFCDDRNVMPIKRWLLGIKGVYEVKDTPVINAVASGNKIKAKTPGNTVAMLADYLRRNKITTVN